MGRLTAIKPRTQEAEGRKFAAPLSDDKQSGWGSGRGGRPWRRKRETILIRDKYTCQACVPVIGCAISFIGSFGSAP